MMVHKVAILATVYRHIEAFHLHSISLLQQKGCEVHAYAYPDQGKIEVQNKGVICHDIFFKRTPFHFDNIKALRMLFQSFTVERFDLIHVHTPVASVLGRIAAKITGVPCVIYTAHGFHFFSGAPILHWLLFYPVERWLAKWTDYLITINDEDYQRAKHFAVRKEVLYVPGVGVDTSQYKISNKDEIRSRKRQELGLKESDFVILSVAELNDNKNIIQLIYAIDYIKKNLKDACDFFPKCILAGNGDLQEQLMEKVNGFGLSEHFCFLGFRKDIPDLMAASDVVTLLSKREGLPKSLMEALAAGKPIVTTNVRGNRDLVEDGVNGFVVPVGDVQKTAEAFIKLIKNEKMRIRMGEVNRKKAKIYDLKNILVQMEKIYDKALNDIR